MQDLRAGRDTCPVHGTLLNGFETFTFCNKCDGSAKPYTKDAKVILDFQAATTRRMRSGNTQSVSTTTITNSTVQPQLPFFIDGDYFLLPQTSTPIVNKTSVVAKGTRIISLFHTYLPLGNVQYAIRKMEILRAIAPNTFITHTEKVVKLTHLVKTSCTEIEVNGVLHEII